MQKVTRQLEYVNIREGTIRRKEVEGYLFQGNTNDGMPVDLYTYKMDGDWYVNEDYANSKVINVPKPTRKDAVTSARDQLKVIDLEQFVNKTQAINYHKNSCEVTKEAIV